jgi:hypothetical protein|tara:strand:- start:5966 stop:6442 length:477 start_codon:yes stop_codon:yes gene_type:complete
MIDQERTRYWAIVSAVDDLVDDVLDARAFAMLKAWDKRPYAHASQFREELSMWPFSGDPVSASRAEVMFYAFKEETGADQLQDQLIREISSACAQAIKTWEQPMLTLIEEACSFDQDLVPQIGVEKAHLHAKAAQALSAKIYELLRFSDHDILLDADE